MTGSKNVLSVSFSQKDLEADEELHEGVTVMKMISKGLKLKKNWPAKKNPKNGLPRLSDKCGHKKLVCMHV